MASADNAGSPPISPCVRICELDAQRTHCIGCGRTLEEISQWRKLDAASQAAILARLADWPKPSPRAD